MFASPKLRRVLTGILFMHQDFITVGNNDQRSTCNLTSGQLTRAPRGDSRAISPKKGLCDQTEAPPCFAGSTTLCSGLWLVPSRAHKIFPLNPLNPARWTKLFYMVPNFVFLAVCSSLHMCLTTKTECIFVNGTAATFFCNFAKSASFT